MSVPLGITWSWFRTTVLVAFRRIVTVVGALGCETKMRRFHLAKPGEIARS
jgi:hypothetical protein